MDGYLGRDHRERAGTRAGPDSPLQGKPLGPRIENGWDRLGLKSGLWGEGQVSPLPRPPTVPGEDASLYLEPQPTYLVLPQIGAQWAARPMWLPSPKGTAAPSLPRDL